MGIGKLTKKQKKQLVADYVMMRSFRKVAEKYDISHVAAANIVRQNQELYDELTLLEAETVVKDLKERLEARKDVIASILDICLFTLADPEKIQSAQPQHVAQVFSTFYEKFVAKQSDMSIENAGVVILPQQAKVKFEEEDDGTGEI